MNFSFMIMIVLVILLFFAFKRRNSKNAMFFLLATIVILLLNEIYNYTEFLKEKYQDSVSNEQTNTTLSATDEYLNKYNFDREINIYNRAYNEKVRTEFDGVIIPNNKFTELGMQCSLEKKILDTELQSKKLHFQDLYSNHMLEYIENAPDRTRSIVNWDSTNPDVFNPIYDNLLTKEKECPTVCHIIEDTDKCRMAKHVPHFNETRTSNDPIPSSEVIEYTTWKNSSTNKCNNLTTQEHCNSDTDCYFDSIDGVCRYDKRKCLSPNVATDECHKRCSFFSIDETDNEVDEQIAKINCKSAKLYDGTPYCNWNENSEHSKPQCEPKCEFYDEGTCETDPLCILNGDKCVSNPLNC